MYTKITRSGGRQYVQLVEGYRNGKGKVRHRVIANLGRLEELSPQKLDPLINGLNRVLGRSQNTAFPIEVESAKSYDRGRCGTTRPVADTGGRRSW